MNRSIVFLLGAALVVPTVASGQSVTASIERALAALPENDREDAAVI